MTDALATPEKRLFVSLITRDITLADAILDLLDNSINAAMQEVSNPLNSARSFFNFLTSPNTKLKVEIRVKISEKEISVVDNAGGIEFESARDGIFHFGVHSKARRTKDRLSVFGIGMKRALFKIGNRISMVSDHPKGGFSLSLDVQEWEEKVQNVWGFPNLHQRERVSEKNTGTAVKITELHDDVRRRVSDETFVPALIEKISKTYSYFLGRFIKISVNGKNIVPMVFDIGRNFTHENYKTGTVEYNITVGIGRSSERFTYESAGWFVFCNGRALLYADKTEQTGWGGEILPIFQPKHRPFFGMVFFYSGIPEDLPWTTTKDSINQESQVWQDARRHMGTLARPLIKLLDERYTDEGTLLDVAALKTLASDKTNLFEATVSDARRFSTSKKMKSDKVKVQYEATMSELELIKKHLGKSSMSATAIGRTTFEYYLRNEVGTK